LIRFLLVDLGGFYLNILSFKKEQKVRTDHANGEIVAKKLILRNTLLLMIATVLITDELFVALKHNV